MNLNDLLSCCRRELEFRQRVYPKWVAKKTMKEAKAQAEIELMRSVVDFLVHCVFKAVTRRAKTMTDAQLMVYAQRRSPQIRESFNGHTAPASAAEACEPRLRRRPVRRQPTPPPPRSRKPRRRRPAAGSRQPPRMSPRRTRKIPRKRSLSLRRAQRAIARLSRR